MVLGSMFIVRVSSVGGENTSGLTYPLRIPRIIRPGKGNSLGKLQRAALGDSDLRAAGVELCAHTLIGNVEAENLMTEEVFARSEFRGDRHGPFGALHTEEIRGPGGVC